MKTASRCSRRLGSSFDWPANVAVTIPTAPKAIKAAKDWNPLAVFSLPLVAVIYVANLLSFFWVDYLYGLAVGLMLPEFVLEQIVNAVV